MDASVKGGSIDGLQQCAHTRETCSLKSFKLPVQCLHSLTFRDEPEYDASHSQGCSQPSWMLPFHRQEDRGFEEHSRKPRDLTAQLSLSGEGGRPLHGQLLHPAEVGAWLGCDLQKRWCRGGLQGQLQAISSGAAAVLGQVAGQEGLAQVHGKAPAVSAVTPWPREVPGRGAWVQKVIKHSRNRETKLKGSQASLSSLLKESIWTPPLSVSAPLGSTHEESSSLKFYKSLPSPFPHPLQHHSLAGIVTCVLVLGGSGRQGRDGRRGAGCACRSRQLPLSGLTSC